MALSENMMESLRDRLKQLMEDHKYSQKQLAELSGLSQNDISSLVGKNQREKKTISGEQLFAIADALNVSIDWLVGRTDYREVVYSEEQRRQDFDYSKVTVGDLNRTLAFAAACGMLQIISPDSSTECISLRVIDKQLSEFLRRLQKKAIDVITDPDETEYLTDWFEKKCSNNQVLAPFDGNIISSVDKYHGAFPWGYVTSIGENIAFDFDDAEWRNDNPSAEWDSDRADIITYAENCSYGAYKDYLELFDGITGYYYCSTNRPKAPHLTGSALLESINVMKIVNDYEVDMPELP